MPAIGTSRSRLDGSTWPYTSEELLISGSIDFGMPRTPRISSSHEQVARSMNSVREAFVTSVTCTPPSVPPVRFHSTHESVVPNSSSPASAFSRAPSTFSRIQTIFVPAK